MCENLNVEIATGPGYMPTSNAIVERHYAVIDRILKKILTRYESSGCSSMGNTHSKLISRNIWMESVPACIWQEPKAYGVGGDKLPALTGTITEAVAGHLDNLLSAQRNYREAVNLKKIKTALAHKIRSTEREFKKKFKRKCISRKRTQNKGTGTNGQDQLQ